MQLFLTAFILFIGWLGCETRLHALPSVVWQEGMSELDLQPHMDFLSVPPSLELTPGDILFGTEFQERFRPLSDKGSASFGYTKNTVWFRVNLENGSYSEQNLLLGSERAEHTSLHIYVLRNGFLRETYQLGSAIPYESRLRPSRIPLAPLHLGEGEKVQIYFALKSQQALSLQFSLQTSKSATEFERLDNIILFFYFGAMLFMVFYSLFLGISLRQGAYFLYSIFGVTIVVVSFVYSGWLEVFGLQIGTISGSADTPKILLIPFLFSSIYCHAYFRVGEIAPRLAWINRAIIAFIAVAAILNLGNWGADFRVLITVGQTLNFLAIFSMVYVGIRSKVPGASYQAFAWVTLFLCSIVWTLGNEGYIEKSLLVAYSILIGNLFEMFMGAIALGIYVKDLERKKFDAQIKEQESIHLRTLVFVVCHDIANPLSIITGMTSLIKPMMPQAELPLRFLDKIERAAFMIEAIINQVRRLEAIRTGKYTLQLEAVSVRSLIDDIQFTFQDRAQKKGVRLELPIDTVSPQLGVEAERTSLLNDVLNNFLSNALKFSEEGQVIQVLVEEGDDFVAIRVVDQGIGMPAELIEKLFNAGAATSRRGTQNEVGTGFGMPLAKFFVDKYGGTIEVISREKGIDGQEPQGTTIITRLKRAELPEQNAASKEEAA